MGNIFKIFSNRTKPKKDEPDYFPDAKYYDDSLKMVGGNNKTINKRKRGRKTHKRLRKLKKKKRTNKRVRKTKKLPNV